MKKLIVAAILLSVQAFAMAAQNDACAFILFDTADTSCLPAPAQTAADNGCAFLLWDTADASCSD